MPERGRFAAGLRAGCLGVARTAVSLEGSKPPDSLCCLRTVLASATKDSRNQTHARGICGLLDGRVGPRLVSKAGTDRVW